MSGARLVVGVDAGRGGWVAVALQDGRFREAAGEKRVAGLLERFPDAECFGVDIPIGLADRGWRAADVAARARLGRRAATVFPTPPRAVLETGDHGKAVELCRRLTDGKGVSRQSHGLRHRILEVDALDDPRLHEVHPELSFAELHGEVLLSSKKTWTGLQERLQLLRAAGIELPPRLPVGGDASESSFLPGLAAPDDVVDAAAVAWSAHRIATGRAVPHPRQPQAGTPVIWT